MEEWVGTERKTNKGREGYGKVSSLVVMLAESGPRPKEEEEAC